MQMNRKRNKVIKLKSGTISLTPGVESHEWLSAKYERHGGEVVVFYEQRLQAEPEVHRTEAVRPNKQQARKMWTFLFWLQKLMRLKFSQLVTNRQDYSYVARRCQGKLISFDNAESSQCWTESTQTLRCPGQKSWKICAFL